MISTPLIKLTKMVVVMLVMLLMLTKVMLFSWIKAMLVLPLAIFYPFVSPRRLFVTIGVGLEL